MHSYTSGAVIKEGRKRRLLKSQEHGSQIIRDCRNIVLCFLLLIALDAILSSIITLATNHTFPAGLLIILGVPLLAVGVCLYCFLYHCRRIKQETGEGAAGETSLQAPNATSTVLTLLGEDHTETNDHRDRPHRQQLTTRTTSSDPHHYVVVADHPNSPTQVGPDVSSPHDSLPSYEMVMKYSYLFKVPQPPSS